MIQASNTLVRLNEIIKKKRIRIPGFQLTNDGIVYALTHGGLSEDTLSKFNLMLEAYQSGQLIYGSHFNNALLIRLVESFLVFARSTAENARPLSPSADPNPLSTLARNTNEQLLINNIVSAEAPLSPFLGVLKPKQVASLFKWKTKKGKNRTVVLPKQVEQGEFLPFTYVSWTVEQRMYLVTKRDNLLMGLEMSFSQLKPRGNVPRMGLCDFCHGQYKIHETASITARVPTSKLPPFQSYKSVGRYICVDHVTCNQKLYSSNKADRIAQFVESVNQNTPLIL